MDFGTVFIEYLVAFYDVAQLRVFWKQAGDAWMSRSTCLIHITGTKYEGQESEGLSLATPAEIQGFMTACKAAIGLLEGGTGIDASQLGTGVDFSRRPVSV